MESKSTKDNKFDSIYRAHKNSIYRVAMHYAKNEDLAEEITQRAFFQLYTHFENVDLETVHPWLVTTARNLTFNHIRDKKHEVLSGIFEIILDVKDKLYYSSNMEDEYLRNSQKKLAESLDSKIFEHLYKEHKRWYEAITLVYCLEKSQKEAAEELGITVEALNSRIYRARQWIRKNYQKEYEEVVNWF